MKSKEAGRLGWHEGQAEKGKFVEVWFGTGLRVARWDGQNWIERGTDSILVGVTHWREEVDGNRRNGGLGAELPGGAEANRAGGDGDRNK